MERHVTVFLLISAGQTPPPPTQPPRPTTERPTQPTTERPTGPTKPVTPKPTVNPPTRPKFRGKYTRAKINNLINVVNNLLQCCAAPCQQCCAAPCQQLLSTTIVHSCSRSTTIVQSLLTTINKLFSSTIVSSCSNNIVTIIVLCQHRTTIDRTILINIVNLTSVVEP